MLLRRRDDPSMATQVGSFELGLLGNPTDKSATGLPQDTNGPKLLIITWVTTVVMLVVVAARFYTRKFLLGFLGWDDWCMLLAVLNSIAMHGVNVRGVDVGQGKHIWNIDLGNMSELLQLAWIGSCFYVISLGFMKISLMIQLLRFCLPGSKTKKLIIGVFTLALMFSVANCAVVIFQCKPIDYMWTRVNPGMEGKGVCLDFTVVGYSVTSTNMVIDLMIWLAPMRLVWKLDLPKTQKVGLVAVFSLGGVALFAAIARMVNLVKTFNNPRILLDGPYYTADTIIWSLLEANIAIIASSLLPLRPLFRRLFPTLFKPAELPMSPIQLGSQRTKLRTNAQERDFAGYSSSTEELANPEDGRNGARGRDMVSEQTNCEGSLVRSVRTIEESKVISAGS